MTGLGRCMAGPRRLPDEGRGPEPEVAVQPPAIAWPGEGAAGPLLAHMRIRSGLFRVIRRFATALVSGRFWTLTNVVERPLPVLQSSVPGFDSRRRLPGQGLFLLLALERTFVFRWHLVRWQSCQLRLRCPPWVG